MQNFDVKVEDIWCIRCVHERWRIFPSFVIWYFPYLQTNTTKGRPVLLVTVFGVLEGSLMKRLEQNAPNSAVLIEF